jgi:hypothetical protein
MVTNFVGHALDRIRIKLSCTEGCSEVYDTMKADAQGIHERITNAVLLELEMGAIPENGKARPKALRTRADGRKVGVAEG